MALKTTVECTTYRSVGISRIDYYYEIEGVRYPTHVALYDANDTFISFNEYNTCQFDRLSSDTDYILKTVYMDTDTGEEILGIVPDTTVQFHTKTPEYYTPVVSASGGEISVSALSDSVWMPDVSVIDGFGIGVELCDENNNILAHSITTPCTFDSYTGEPAYVQAYLWKGRVQSPSSCVRYAAVPNTQVEIEQHEGILDVFCFPRVTDAELHVRLQDFNAPSSIEINVDGAEVGRLIDNITNKVYVVKLNELEQATAYEVEVIVTDGGNTTTATASFTTGESTSAENSEENVFKDFWIAVGQPGAYSQSMEYSEVFGMNTRFGIKIQHAPYSPMAKIKNVVVQSWKDEDGDDVWLPRVSSGLGSYAPAVTHEAVEYNAKFVIFGDKEKVDSNAVIREMLKLIEGRWLKIWDEYTQMGFEGVYLIDVDDDPKFKRRNYDHVEFTLKFKINGTNIDAPFEGVG